MKEKELLEWVRNNLETSFERVQRKLSQISDDDPKFVSLLTIQQKLAKSISDFVALQRNPRLNLSNEADKKFQSDLARLIQDTKEEEKRTLMTIKGGPYPRKRSLMVRKRQDGY